MGSVGQEVRNGVHGVALPSGLGRSLDFFEVLRVWARAARGAWGSRFDARHLGPSGWGRFPMQRAIFPHIFEQPDSAMVDHAPDFLLRITVGFGGLHQLGLGRLE